jgi:hypothetical protein
MRLTALLAAVVCVVVLAGAGRASERPAAASVTVRLVPEAVTRTPVGVHRGTRGTFSASFWPFGSSQSARWALSTRRLTGPAMTAHIHTGAPGRNGPVLITVCTSGRCNLSGSSFHTGLPAGLIRTMRLLGAYVDVHTERNPRGELRGQIVFED